MAHAQHDRKKQNRHHRNGARCRFERPSNHQTPCPAGEMNHHEDREAAQRNTNPEDVGHEISLIKALDTHVASKQHEAENAQNNADKCGGHAQTLNARDALWRRVRFNGRHYRSSAPRLSAGTSSTFAFWLSCSARTYATISQRSRTGTWSAYPCIAPKPFVITS